MDCEARSPTIANTGSMGMTRPMMKVMNKSPSMVTAMEPSVTSVVFSQVGRRGSTPPRLSVASAIYFVTCQ